MGQETTVQLDLTDIQGNILRSYSMPFARFFFLEVIDPEKSKASLQHVISLVTTAEAWDEKPAYTFNLAFSYAGLVRLGAAATSLALFSTAFRSGMKSRATVLGDNAESDPSKWEAGLAGSNLHIMVGLYSQTAEDRASQSTQLRDHIAQAGGSRIVYEQDGEVQTEGREHFGFEDGISQPAVEGSAAAVYLGDGTPMPDGTWAPVKAGEFVFGYVDEAGSKVDPTNPNDLRINGSYCVVRKLGQKVGAFRDFIQQTASQVYWDTSNQTQELIAAKMVGRWRSGAPLPLAAQKDDPTLGKDNSRNNNFRFKDDPVGYGCPRGSHIRRCNPRDALDNTATVVRRHRMLRRGIAYGPPLPPGAKEDNVDRGLFFVAMCADIERQFEFVQQQWVNRGDFADLDMAEKDAIIGNNSNNGQYSIPSETGIPKMLFDLPRFVITRGGEYFFLPGIKALKRIAGTE